MATQLALPAFSIDGFILESESWISGTGKYVRTGRNKEGDFKIQYCEIVDDQVVVYDSYIPVSLAAGVIRVLVSNFLTTVEQKAENAG